MCTTFKVTHSLFAVCLLSFVYFRESIIATRPAKAQSNAVARDHSSVSNPRLELHLYAANQGWIV
jgi:hypothetical protein